jgi:glutathione S-transferase
MPIDPNAPIEVTAYEWVPPMAHGFVKDLRVRWALEEIELPYRERLVGGAGGSDADKSAAHFADQPFGQVPVLKEDGLTLFESGAILMHIGEKDERLLPRDPAMRKRAIGWMIAALNSIEPFSQTLLLMGFVADGKDWQSEAKAATRPFVEMRLAQLAKALGTREWLEDRFTIGDLVMIDVLRAMPEFELVTVHRNLAAYVERGISRQAFKAAMAAQLAVFAANMPSSEAGAAV